MHNHLKYAEICRDKWIIDCNLKRGSYDCTLNKSLYLLETDVRAERDITDFIKLIGYLDEHPEFGINPTYAQSELNKYVYYCYKYYFTANYSRTCLDALDRFYDNPKIRDIYTILGNSEESQTIDLVGKTRVGKTTLIQQFVDESGKKVLELTKDSVGNSTIVNTDILIHNNKDSKIILLFSSYETIKEKLFEYILDPKTSEIQVDERIILSDEYAELQRNSKPEDYSNENVQKHLDYLIELILLSMKETLNDYLFPNVIEENFAPKIKDFFDNSFIINMDKDCKDNKKDLLIGSFMSNKNIIRKNKLNVVSFNFLVERAFISLNFSNEAKKNFNPYIIENGLCMIDTIGHNSNTQIEKLSDKTSSYKIVIMTVGTGSLVDESSLDIFNNISSPAANTIIIINKVDANDIVYDALKNDDFSDLKMYIYHTYENIIDRYYESDLDSMGIKDSGSFSYDKRAAYYKIIEYFQRSYLVSLGKSKDTPSDDKIAYQFCLPDTINKKSNLKPERFDEELINITKLNSIYDIVNNTIKAKTRKNKTIRDYCSKIVNEDFAFNTTELVSDIYSLVLKYILDNRDTWKSYIIELVSLFEYNFRDTRGIIGNSRSWFRNIFENDFVVFVGDGSTEYNYYNVLTIMINSIRSYIYTNSKKNCYESFVDKLYGQLKDKCDIVESNKLRMILYEVIEKSIVMSLQISYKLYERNYRMYYPVHLLLPVFSNDKRFLHIDDMEWDRYHAGKFTFTGRNIALCAHLISKFEYNINEYFQKTLATILNKKLFDIAAQINI